MSAPLPPDVPKLELGRDTVSSSRRRLIQGGLTAAPLVLSVSSKSVMAQSASGRCTTASAFGSMNASRPSHVTSCHGRRPEYWRERRHFDEWPQGYVPGRGHGQGHGHGHGGHGTRFSAVFGNSAGFLDATLLDVLHTRGHGHEEVARLCVAAMLNAAKGLTPAHVLSPFIVRDVWQSFASRGYYEPTSGIRWYAHSSEPAGTGGLVEWLMTTMPR